MTQSASTIAATKVVACLLLLFCGITAWGTSTALRDVDDPAPPGANAASPEAEATASPAAPSAADRNGDVRQTAEMQFGLVVHVIDATPDPTASSGRGLPSAHVALVSSADGRACGSGAYCDARGVAHLEGIPPGMHRLRVSAAGFTVHEQTIAFDPARLEQDPHLRGRPLVVRLHGVAARISGLLLTADSQLAAGALVFLDTRTQAVSPVGTRPRSPARSRSAASCYTVTDDRGFFELDTLRGFSEQTMIVCAGRSDSPLLVRRPLTADEIGHGASLQVVLPRAAPIEFRCERADGSLGQGKVDVIDDRAMPWDLEADPVLKSVPGIARWNVIERAAGRLVVPLAPGGYKVFFDAGSAAQSRAFFLVLPENAGTTHVLRLDS